MLKKVKSLEECEFCNVYHSIEDDCNISENKGINTKKWLRNIKRLAWVVLIYFLTPKGYVIITQLIHFFLFFIGSFLERVKPSQDDNRTIMEVVKDLTWAEWVYILLFYFLILYKIPSYFAPKGFCIIYSLFFLYATCICIKIFLLLQQKRKKNASRRNTRKKNASED